MPKIEAFQKYANEYDNWSEINKFAFESELNAIKNLLPNADGVIEIGIGSGIFAEPLGIKEGIDPSEAMRKKAQEKELNVLDAVAEKLPYAEHSINGAVMITTICFVVIKAQKEEAGIYHPDNMMPDGQINKFLK